MRVHYDHGNQSPHNTHDHMDRGVLDKGSEQWVIFLIGKGLLKPN